jgi:hypothetical protein
MDLDLEGNRFTELDERLCVITEWMNRLVGAYGCDALLCHVGSAGGRQRFDDAPCARCPPLGDENATGVSRNRMGQEPCQTLVSMEDGDEEALVEMLYTNKRRSMEKRGQLVGAAEEIHLRFINLCTGPRLCD